MRERDSGDEPVAAARARTKWVSHGLSNAIVYGGLHYGAQWLPMAVLNGINLVGNTLAITFLREDGRPSRTRIHSCHMTTDASRIGR